MAVFMPVFLAVMAMFHVVASAPASSFKFGVVSSQSGALTDWNDAVKGANASPVQAFVRL